MCGLLCGHRLLSGGREEVTACEHTQCLILKPLTHVKCHFGCQKRAFLFGTLHKNVLCKVSTNNIEGLSKIACHKIQWLQFANRNIYGVQCWHSSIHFRIPITVATSTRHWLHSRESALLRKMG